LSSRSAPQRLSRTPASAGRIAGQIEVDRVCLEHPALEIAMRDEVIAR
jgi:hypothetical protein